MWNLRYPCALIVITSLCWVTGCGGVADHSMTSGDETLTQAPPPEVVLPDSTDTLPGATLPETADAANTGQNGAVTPDPQATVNQIQRQIIYEAQLDLLVEQFDGVLEQVGRVTRQHGGFIADSTVNGDTGSKRYGRWTLRVPVSQYGTFVDTLSGIGELETLTTGSREVTAEYYDILARISNKQKKEARLLEILEKQTGRLEDVLQVEEQIAHVREEIERMQGRMRVLKDLTAFSTVTLSVREIHPHVPPESPTFGDRIARTWTGTIDSLTTAGQNLVIAFVAVAPWLVVLAIPLSLFYLIGRAILRRIGIIRSTVISHSSK